jgi:magnesium chelatase family protein
MGPGEVQTFRQLDEQSRQVIKAALQQLEPSACAYYRALQLAGSPLGAIADLAGNAQLRTYHRAKALPHTPGGIM